MIKVVEVLTKKQMKDFATFPIKHYKGCPYFVPSLVDDEKCLLDPKKNLMLGNNKLKCFLAYKDGKLVGRIAGIISVDGNKKFNEKAIRFSRVEFIEDIDVLKALLNAVVEFGKENGLDTLSGPWGFNDTDREGMLTYGFNELSNYATSYSYPYYARFFEELGFKKESEWIEYDFNTEQHIEKFEEHANRLREQGYREVVVNMSIKKFIKLYGTKFFDCYNKAYANLDNFVKIENEGLDQMIKQFSTIINPKFFSCIVNKDDEVVAFGVGVPHIGKALQLGKGRVILSAIPILFSYEFPKIIELALIGVDPAYTNYGVHALVVEKFLKNFKKYKIKKVWMDPVLTTNLKMQNSWSKFDKKIRQKRQTWRIPFSELK